MTRIRKFIVTKIAATPLPPCFGSAQHDKQNCQSERSRRQSNHVHLIVRAKDDNLSAVIRDLKKFTSKKIFAAIDVNPEESRRNWIVAIFKKSGEFNYNNVNFQFWQQHNQPIELFSIKAVEQKLEYIHENPVKAGIVENSWEYLYSSARDYADMKGLLEVELV